MALRKAYDSVQGLNPFEFKERFKPRHLQQMAGPPQVSIPLSSGNVSNSRSPITGDGMRRLNPFEFRERFKPYGFIEQFA